jgi:hypothetical protein
MGVVVWPARAVVATRAHSAHVRIHLRAQPVNELGPALLRLTRHRRGADVGDDHDQFGDYFDAMHRFDAKRRVRDDSGDAITTFRARPDHLVFTPTNWHEPQRMQLDYVEDGDIVVCAHVTGGGYDWLLPHCQPIHVTTCAGVERKGVGSEAEKDDEEGADREVARCVRVDDVDGNQREGRPPPPRPHGAE